MSWSAMSYDPQPESCLLAPVNSDIPDSAVFEQVLSAFIDQELRVPEQVRLMCDEPVRARAFGFFVGYSEKDYVAVEFHLLALQHDHHNQLREAFIFHVLCAASPEPPVLDLAAEGRNFPVCGIAGDHIHVVEQDDRLLRFRGGMRYARPNITAARGKFENAILNSFLIENLFVKRNSAHLMSGRVRGVDAQVLLHPG